MAYLQPTGPDTFRLVDEREVRPQIEPPNMDDWRRRREADQARREAFPGVSDWTDRKYEDYWDNKQQDLSYPPVQLARHTQRGTIGEPRQSAYFSGPFPAKDAPPLTITPIATPGGMVRHHVYNQYRLTPEAERAARAIQLRFWPTDNYTEIPEGAGGNYGNNIIRMWLPREPTSWGAASRPRTFVHELGHYMHENYLRPEDQEALQSRQWNYVMGPRPSSESPAATSGIRFEARMRDQPGNVHFGFDDRAISNEMYASMAEDLTGDEPKYLPEDMRRFYRPMFSEIPPPHDPVPPNMRPPTLKPDPDPGFPYYERMERRAPTGWVNTGRGEFGPKTPFQDDSVNRWQGHTREFWDGGMNSLYGKPDEMGYAG